MPGHLADKRGRVVLDEIILIQPLEKSGTLSLTHSKLLVCFWKPGS
jgi:hypothetical protein